MSFSYILPYMNKPLTLQQAIVYFSDVDRAFQYAVSLRWADGKVTCPRCNSEKHSFIKTRRIWFCYGCKKQFTVKVGTIFEDSPIGLDKWMTAVWMITVCKNGVSSYEIHRSIGVTQKSAWFMLHRIRLAMQNRSILKLGGSGKEIEADESFIGGAARFMHPARRRRVITARGFKDKSAAFGILERGGDVRVFAVPNRRKKSLQTRINEHVERDTHVYTDALMSYMGLNTQGYAHKVVDHANGMLTGAFTPTGSKTSGLCSNAA